MKTATELISEAGRAIDVHSFPSLRAVVERLTSQEQALQAIRDTLVNAADWPQSDQLDRIERIVNAALPDPDADLIDLIADIRRDNANSRDGRSMTESNRAIIAAVRAASVGSPG